MGTQCPYTCRQWIPFYFSRTSFTSAQWLLLALGPPQDMADSLSTGPQRQFSPGQLSGGKKPVKMPNNLLLTKSVISGADRGPAVATRDHPQAPCQLHHPPWQGDVLESSMQTPSGSWLGWGAHRDPFLPQYLQARGSE